jgi:hypothetical protein
LSTILKACFDETGTHDGALITCMGGYVFDEAGEQEFIKEWVRFLQPFSLRGIKVFHANKCHGLKGEFDVLDKDDKEKLFTSLIALTRRTAKLGMVSGIRDEVFKTVIARNKFQTFTGSKYTVCALRSLTLIKQWADENRFNGKIIYQFESGNEHQGEANAMMNAIKKSPQMRATYYYQHHEFIEKSLLPPLQAADMLVWLFQRWFSRNRQDHFLKALFQKGSIRHMYQEITDLSVSMLALQNMHYGVKSDRKYETQKGPTKTYRI